MRKGIQSSSATVFWMNQVGTWCNRPGVWTPYARHPHLALQLPLHRSHLRSLPAQFGYQAPALSNENPTSEEGLSIPPPGIPSHLLRVSIHPIHPSNCNLPLKPPLLAWVIILNYWNDDCIIGTFIYLKLIYWAPLTHQAEDSVLCDYICIYLYPLPECESSSSRLCLILNPPRASLVAQWLRVCLPMQGTRVRALIWEDPTCCGATGPVSRNYWVCASGACAPQQERPR